MNKMVKIVVKEAKQAIVVVFVVWVGFPVLISTGLIGRYDLVVELVVVI